MGFNATQTEALKAKLDGSHVKTRQQAGRTLSYLEGWVAIAEANRIFGFGEWDRETVDIRQLGQIYDNHNGNKVANYFCRVRVTVRTGSEAVVREGCGFGSGIDKDEGQAHESAIKEAETDAMKRALMTFGNPFGLALYDKKQADVEKTPPTPKPPPPKVEPPKDTVHVVGNAELDFLAMLGDCNTAQAVENFIKDNKNSLASLPNGGGDRVTNAARNKFSKLKKEAA